ncbi:hypothetical protein J6590_049385 [Homalodisca vitripennis]|nr:hypothetical protein J6590_049385 [Homalodisca vitripennis]
MRWCVGGLCDAKIDVNNLTSKELHLRGIVSKLTSKDFHLRGRYVELLEGKTKDVYGAGEAALKNRSSPIHSIEPWRDKSVKPPNQNNLETEQELD